MKNGLKWLINVFGHSESKQVAKAWQNTFDINNEEARKVLQDLALYCNFYTSSFVSNDNNYTSFNEGARDVFLHILEMSNLSVEDIMQLHTITGNTSSLHSSENLHK